MFRNSSVKINKCITMAVLNELWCGRSSPTLCNSGTLPWMVRFLLLNFLIVHIHSLLKMYQLNSLLRSGVRAVIMALARANTGMIVAALYVSMDIFSCLLCTYGFKYSSKKTQKPPLKVQLPRKGFIDAIDNLLLCL